MRWKTRQCRSLQSIMGPTEKRMVLDRDPKTVVPVDPRLIGAAGHVAPPALLIEIPVNGLFNSGLELDAALLIQFACEFGGVDRITVIVTRPVGHIADEPA